jgi:hypothetical protein
MHAHTTYSLLFTPLPGLTTGLTLRSPSRILSTLRLLRTKAQLRLDPPIWHPPAFTSHGLVTRTDGHGRELSEWRFTSSCLQNRIPKFCFFFLSFLLFPLRLFPYFPFALRYCFGGLDDSVTHDPALGLDLRQ